MREPRFDIPGIGLTGGVLADVLRLEVETDPVGLANLIVNPDGRLGGYGWVSPIAGTVVRAGAVGSVSHLEFMTSTSAVATHYTSEAIAVTAGHYVATSFREIAYTTTAGAPASGGYYRPSFEFLNSAGAVVSTVGIAGILLLAANTQRTWSSTLVPAGAVKVRLRLDMYSSAAAANPTANRVYAFNRFALATDTSPIATLPYDDPVPTVDILGPTHKIDVSREALAVGTLAAEILDATIDPADADLIRPGRAVRLSARDSAGAWGIIFTGEINKATVSYHMLEDIPDRKRARITLTAVDNIATLAAAVRNQSVATIDELPYVLEGAGVPWSCNGSGDQVATATVRATADNVTALDQTALTRDTSRGYAWVDRLGILQAWDADEISTTPVLTLDETVYSDAEIGFDTDALINEVSVTVRSTDSTGQTIETTTTYTDAASIAAWGRKRAEFTVLAPTNAATFAAAVLAANATPAVRINTTMTSVRNAALLDVAHLDLYDAVTLDSDAKAINQLARVSAIKMSIDKGSFFIDHAFGDPDAVASPQTVPPLPSSGNNAAQAYSEAAGTAVVTLSSASSGNAAATVFPAGRFTAAPLVTFGVIGTSVLTAGSINTPTTGGMTVFVRDPSGTPRTGTFTVHWHAVQMTPTSAAG